MSCPGTHPEDDHQNPDCQRAQRRPHEIALQAFKRSLAPRQQRSHGRQQKQQQGHRNRHFVVEGRPHRDFVALHVLRDQREPRAPQHGEARQQQQQIIEQEARLARNQRLQLMLAAQVRLVFEKEKSECCEA